MSPNRHAIDTRGAQRVIIATLRAWIGFRLNPNGKNQFELLYVPVNPAVRDADQCRVVSRAVADDLPARTRLDSSNASGRIFRFDILYADNMHPYVPKGCLTA